MKYSKKYMTKIKNHIIGPCVQCSTHRMIGDTGNISGIFYVAVYEVKHTLLASSLQSAPPSAINCTNVKKESRGRKVDRIRSFRRSGKVKSVHYSTAQNQLHEIKLGMNKILPRIKSIHATR